MQRVAAILRRIPLLYQWIVEGKMSYYAVGKGKKPGIYRSWEMCKEQVHQFSGARFKKFSTRSAAQQYIADCNKVVPKTQNVYRTKVQRYQNRMHPYRGHSSDDQTSSRDDFQQVVFSDGCCLSNGRKSARAGVGVYWGDQSPHNVSERLHGSQTNQRAELVSACRAVEGAISQNLSKIEVRTDSLYTIQCVTQWVKKWESNGWKTVGGKGVINKDDIQRLLNLSSQLKIKWTHVRGHQGFHGNEAADRLAKAGATKD